MNDDRSRCGVGDGLGVAAVRGVFWIGGGQLLRQAIQLIASVALARLLAPDDYGLLGMALVFVGLAQLFADFGLEAALIQTPSLSRTLLSACFWLSLAIGVILAGGLALGSRALAGLAGDARLAPILWVMSITLPLGAIGVVPRALIYRNLQFDRLVKAQVVASLSGAALAILLAAFGGGVWSIVFQPLIGATVATALVFWYAQWRPGLRCSWAGARSLIVFSGAVLGSDLLNHAMRNADRFLIGRHLGSVALGHYSLAYQVMLYPLSQISGVIVKVLFPTLSKLTGEPHRFRQAYLKCVSTIATVTFPLMIGLFAVASDFVVVVFGEKWLPMLPILQILCWVGMLQSVTTTASTIFYSKGAVRTLFLLTLAATPFALASFVIGLRWGVIGVAAAYAAFAYCASYVSLALAFRLTALQFREFHRSLVKPLTASLVMYATLAMLAIPLAGENVAPIGRLMVLTGAGAAVYLLVSVVINRRALQELLALVRAALAPSRAATVGAR